MKILVVEDSASIAGTIVRVLKKMLGEPAYVVTCATAEQALRYLNTESFDILLTDWQLPHMSGIDLIIQARQSFPGLKIIFMTGSSIEDVFMTGSSTGDVEETVNRYADVYLAKPFQVSTLMGTIRHLSQRLPN